MVPPSILAIVDLGRLIQCASTMSLMLRKVVPRQLTVCLLPVIAVVLAMLGMSML